MSSNQSANDGRCQVRLRIIKEIISAYNGDEPLHHFLAAEFKKNPGFGSKDRRQYRKWVYAWYRLGNAFSESEFEQRLCMAYYLVNGLDDELSLYLHLKLQLDFLADLNLFERTKLIRSALGENVLKGIFSFKSALSLGVEVNRFTESHLLQPDVFIRVNKGAVTKVRREFLELGISYFETDLENCWQIPSGTALQETASWKKGLFEVQDHNSQKVCQKIPIQSNEYWWDACCGAGGKTLYLADHYPDATFLCTDIRDRILDQFIMRLNRNRVRGVATAVLDASMKVPEGELFDGVLVDAPCSGSGTWTRNPENLVFFDENELGRYADRQLQLLRNCAKALKPGGYLVYVTCSIFAIENEGVVSAFLLNNHYEKLVEEIYYGYLSKSDSLFIAILRKT